MNQAWFEMPDIRKRKLANSVWIALRASLKVEETGEYGHLGYKEDYLGVCTLLVAAANREQAEQLGWEDFRGIENGPICEDGEYIASDIYIEDDEPLGTFIILEQNMGSRYPREWLLHQDFVVALKLKREGDSWYATTEDFVEVARLRRDPDGEPTILEVRAEFLKDYLCARHMGLYVTTFRSRREVLEDVSHIGWPDGKLEVEEDRDTWEGRVHAIHEGGRPYGSTVAVMHIARTDIDAGEDMPAAGDFPADADTETKSWSVSSKASKLYDVSGKLWRTEWLDPGEHSPRVRGDKLEPTVHFITDATGKRENATTLKQGLRWLWFKPEIVEVILSRRTGELGWYTRDTGGIGWAPGGLVHFGVNPLGFVSVLANDIAMLPEWQQKVWAGFNIGPDGGVSAELLASQARATPAATQAPERLLPDVVARLNEATMLNFGFWLFREHDSFQGLLGHAHRFRATDAHGLYSLAKDLARLTADSFDVDGLQKVVAPKPSEKISSLKSLERVLATLLADEGRARALCGPLHGIYSLRLADAHLPSKDLDESLELAGVDKSQPSITQGYQLLDTCVRTLQGVLDAFERKT